MSHGLPAVLWMGGGGAAGKTTISRTIALRFDLAWYRIDGYAYEHQDRLVARGLVDKPDDDYDRRLLTPTAEELAEQFWERSRLTVPLVPDDLRTMDGAVGVVVEGPQLFPELVAPYLAGPGSGLWLVSTEQFQRRVLGARVGDASGFTSDAQRALDNLVRRNLLLNDRTMVQARVRVPRRGRASPGGGCRWSASASTSDVTQSPGWGRMSMSTPAAEGPLGRDVGPSDPRRFYLT